MDHELLPGNDGHARQVWSDLAAFAIMTMALGTLLLENKLAPARVTAVIELWGEPIDHELSIGIGQAATMREQPLACAAISESG